MEGSEDASILREELIQFRERWLLNNKEMAKIFRIPLGTLAGITSPSKGKDFVLPETSRAIRKGMRDYDPRSCIYRRIPKDECAKIFNRIKARHDLNWDQVSEITGASKVRIWGVVTPTSQTKFLSINDIREYMINYNKWLEARAKTWEREGVA